MSRYPATPAPLARAVVEIRGDAAAVARVLSAAGLAAPQRPNSAVASAAPGGDAAVLWIGPRRWLAMADPARETALADAIAAAAAAEPLALAAVVTDMLAGLALQGAGARDLLEQGTPLALDDLGADGATMTELFMVPALLRRAGDGWEIWIDRSLAAYLEECLRVANGGEA
jgi:heterotetrameric sarcosine oxidase gamma subunit